MKARVLSVSDVDAPPVETYDISACRNRNFYVRKEGKPALVHNCGAPEFAWVMNNTKMRYRFGCSGTWTRKDGKHIIIKLVIGGPKSEIKRAQMKASMIVIDTKFKSKGVFKGKVGYVYLCKNLAKNKKRNDLILEWVQKDLEAGHSIVIPLHFKDHIEELVKRINDQVGYEVAAAFVGGGGKKNKERRDWIKAEASKRNIRVVVGIRKLLQRGINIKPWSCLYYVMPMNNPENWKQESSRILTPDPDKRKPIIRFFADSGANASLKYMVNTWTQSLKYAHEPTPTALDRFRAITKNVKRDISHEDADAEAETSTVGVRPTGGLFGGIAGGIAAKRSDNKAAYWKKKKGK